MKAIILAAGYGSRLQKSAKGTSYEKDIINKPKCLIEINNETLLDIIVKKINPFVDEIRLITNQKYLNNFKKWLKIIPKDINKKIILLNDKSTKNENRCGSIKDIAIAGGFTKIIKIKKITEPCLVLSSDRYVNFSFSDLINFYKKKKTSINLGYNLKDKDKAVNHGQIKFDKNNLLTDFAEKANPPISLYTSIGSYLYTKEALNLLPIYLKEEKNHDSPGNFLKYVYKKIPVYIFELKKDPYDIGNLDSYLKARHELEK